MKAVKITDTGVIEIPMQFVKFPSPHLKVQ